MKKVIGFEKHISKDNIKNIAPNLKKLKELDYIENYKNEFLALEFNLKIKNQWPEKLLDYIIWPEYDEIQEFIANWLLRIVEDGKKKERDAVLEFLEKKSFPKDKWDLIEKILNEIKKIKNLKERAKKINKDSGFESSEKKSLKEFIDKSYGEIIKYYEYFKHLKKCNDCLEILNEIIIEEIERKENEMKLAAESASVFSPFVEYKNIYWYTAEIKEAGMKFLFLKFKRKVSDPETKKEIKKGLKNYIVFLAFDNEGNKKEIEIEIKYEDGKTAFLKKEIEETGKKDIVSFKLEEKEYEIEWEESEEDMPYPFMICHKTSIKGNKLENREEIVNEFIKNKEFYKKLYKSIKDVEFKKILCDLFLRLKMKIKELDKLEGINEILKCL